MSFTYDPATDRGYVRLLISDTDPNREILSDAEVDAFLARAADVPQLAAASALEAIANNEALTLKVIQILDLKTDGAATARALREGAERIRTVYLETDEDQLPDTAEMVVDPHTYAERVWNEALR